MILPVSYHSVILLLIASLVCLGVWVNTFKAAPGRWRFELYSIDCAIGAVIVAVAAAYTLGTLGPDLGFGDRIIVAGRTQQALAVIAGAVFALGNMLLLASVSLLGIANAFPLSIGLAVIVASCFNFRSNNLTFLIGGIALMLVSIVFEIRAARLREASATLKKNPGPVAAGVATETNVGEAKAQAPHTGKVASPSTAYGFNPQTAPKARPRPINKPKRNRSVRGIVAGIIGGICLGIFVPILNSCLSGDLGLGPYAGMLLFGLGMLGSTIFCDIYFLNITIDGTPLQFSAYFKGTLGQHLLGVIGGIILMGGLLAAAATLSATAITEPQLPLLRIVLPLASVPLVWIFGVTIWKEMTGPTGAKAALTAGIALFTISFVLIAFGIVRGVI